MKSDTPLQRGKACLCCRKRKMVSVVMWSLIIRLIHTFVCMFRNVTVPVLSAHNVLRQTERRIVSTTTRNRSAVRNYSSRRSLSSKRAFVNSSLNSQIAPDPLRVLPLHHLAPATLGPLKVCAWPCIDLTCL